MPPIQTRRSSRLSALIIGKESSNKKYKFFNQIRYNTPLAPKRAFFFNLPSSFSKRGAYLDTTRPGC